MVTTVVKCYKRETNETNLIISLKYRSAKFKNEGWRK